jgi:hypothetical protein
MPIAESPVILFSLVDTNADLSAMLDLAIWKEVSRDVAQSVEKSENAHISVNHLAILDKSVPMINAKY